MKATREDVAARAGVSGATVSYVFSGKRTVSEELRKKVLNAAEELHYQPDFIARSMVMKSSSTISVLTSDVASPLQMQVVKSLQAEAIDNGFFVNICGGTKNLEQYLDHFIARHVDGVFVSVISSLVSDAYLKKLLDHGISLVITGMRQVDDPRICSIMLDFDYGMRLIIRHLKQLGHSKIAYLSCFNDHYSDDRRLSAFYRHMKTEFPHGEPIVIKGNPPFESTVEVGYRQAGALADSGRPFTAAVCSNDLMAFGAIRAFTERGIRVPADVSVVGIDDIEFARDFTPPLTSLSHAADVYGRKIFEILKANIIRKEDVRHETVSPELIIRESTARAKKT